MEEEPSNGGVGAGVSIFDYSIENHFKAMDAISKLCGEPKDDGLDETDVQRFSSSITFLREWKHFSYEPRIIKFAGGVGDSLGKDVSDGIQLPQFSSAAVAKKQQEGLYGSDACPESCKDFVMYVGGSVWALDWCPRVHENPNSPVKCEFVAVAAHPPDSYYHKMGSPLTGRGIIQIWCMLNVGVNEEEAPLSNKGSKRKSQKTEAPENGPPKRPRGRPRKNPIDVSQANKVKRPKGRPRKNPVSESLNSDQNDQSFQPLAVQYPEVSFEPVALDSAPGNAQENSPNKKRYGKGKGNREAELILGAVPKTSVQSRKLKSKAQTKTRNLGKCLALQTQTEETGSSPTVNQQSQSSSGQEVMVQDNVLDSAPGNAQENAPNKKHHGKGKANREAELILGAVPKTSVQSRKLKSKAQTKTRNLGKCLALQTQTEETGSSPTVNQQSQSSSGQEVMVQDNVLDSNSLEVSPSSCSVPGDIALPRAVLCLAHNGKVAWDVKWQPYDTNNSKCNKRMGYLAVLLGSGSLEVWEVPLPHMIRIAYSSSSKQGTDPRFVKLEPVFKCSKLKCGDTQSIPLTVEWSTSPPHDYLLAGCHDGMVALWKFSSSSSTKDTRPLLCFSADTLPIRSIAWAPCGSDTESTNVILTAGHGGLKFWDLRDPFLPLWDVHPAPKFIYSLDWVPEPRCVILSFDDGTMKMLSLIQAASDAPVTGKAFTAIKQLGLHLYNCSSFAIWNVQVSRITGMVAYCGADGTVTHFQLTSKAVEKDFSRNRAPHFLCGSLTQEESAIIVNTPLPNLPLTLKKPTNDYGDGQKSMRAFLTESNQAKNAKNKKAKDQISDEQNLALTYGNDPGEESDSEETLAALKGKKKQKSRSDKNKRADDDQALAIRTEEQPNMQKEEAGNGIEVFPPKIVAMHRVRWNMNKGSERWLCYGGAAGIVRCQEIRK